MCNHFHVNATKIDDQIIMKCDVIKAGAAPRQWTWGGETKYRAWASYVERRVPGAEQGTQEKSGIGTGGGIYLFMYFFFCSGF